MSAIPAKIILKSTTSKTLNDRFTEVARQLKSPPQVTIGGLRMGQMQQAQATAKNRRLAAQMANRPGVQAALGGPQQQRSNLQSRLGSPNKGPIRGRLGAGFSRGARRGRGSRGGFQQGVTGRGRGGLRRGGNIRRGGFPSPARGGGGFRGRGRGVSRVGRGARGTGGRGARGGRGIGRGRGRGRGGQNVAPKSRDVLDMELDQYMSHSKGHLDAELDKYMHEADGE